MKEHFNSLQVQEFAPWISNLILFFQKQPAIELHIVAPNVFNNTNCSFIKNKIHYHFYSTRSKFVPKKAYTLGKIVFGSNHYYLRSKISKIITEINPDLIHLHGAENPYYSAGIIPMVGKYPILLTIQGFIRNASSKSIQVKRRVKIEQEIITKLSHFGVCTLEMKDILRSINPDAKMFFHDYPVTIPTRIKNNIGNNEPIDCLFFARVSKDKGIEDLLAALSIVKQKFPNVSLTVIGGTNTRYLSHLKNVVSELNLQNNVHFLGFLPTQEDIFHTALQAKICVLPTYHDIIPGTIIESMFMKLPVVAYAVGGIPELTIEDECIMLVNKNNISQLAEKIILLLDNDHLRKTISERAFSNITKRFKNDQIATDIINAYNSILSVT